jgi:hypothetical protein
VFLYVACNGDDLSVHPGRLIARHENQTKKTPTGHQAQYITAICTYIYIFDQAYIYIRLVIRFNITTSANQRRLLIHPMARYSGPTLSQLLTAIVIIPPFREAVLWACFLAINNQPEHKYLEINTTITIVIIMTHFKNCINRTLDTVHCLKCVSTGLHCRTCFGSSL